MKVRLTARARQHLEAIAEYIGERNPSAAVRVGARIRQSIDLLAHFPLIGHAGVLAGTLEKVVVGLPYIIVYRVESDGGNGDNRRRLPRRANSSWTVATLKR
jgi:plasmid stabilization system protein ParE